MYTQPEARGRKLGRAVLDGLIVWAREHGLGEVVLETGDLQAAAIGLYESAGFERIANFGYYVGIENSWCYGLTLSGPGVAAAARPRKRRTRRATGPGRTS